MISKIFTKFKIIAIALLFAILFSTCGDNSNYAYIPDVYVNYDLNLNLPQFSNLIHPGSFAYIDNIGYRGIIVYHTNSGDYIAYERTCTHEPENDCSVIYVDDSGIFMQCGEKEGDCCDSRFDMDGNVLRSPAVYPLKRYRVNRHGEFLTITNVL